MRVVVAAGSTNSACGKIVHGLDPGLACYDFATFRISLATTLDVSLSVSPPYRTTTSIFIAGESQRGQ
jgi:hypothetical protein